MTSRPKYLFHFPTLHSLFFRRPYSFLFSRKHEPYIDSNYLYKYTGDAIPAACSARSASGGGESERGRLRPKLRNDCNEPDAPGSRENIYIFAIFYKRRII